MRLSSVRFTAALCSGISSSYGWHGALSRFTRSSPVAASRYSMARARHNRFPLFSSTVNLSSLAREDVSDPGTQVDSNQEVSSKRPKFRIYYNDVYEVSLPPNHRFPMEKYRMVRERIQETLQKIKLEGSQPDSASPEVDFVVSPRATEEELLTTHDGAYVRRFLNGDMTTKEQRNVGFPWSPEGVDRALSSVGGTMAGALFVAKHLKRQKVQERRNKKDESYTPIWAAHVAGGTHHAFSDYGEGFSVFSDIAVAANVVLQRYPSVVKNILIVDLDVHQGNGNAVLFQQQEHVFTFSMHCSGNYFSEKQNSDLDIELPIGCNDSTYLMTLNHWLKQFQQQHESRKFDLIFFQAGVDPLSADRLGRMDLSSDGLRRRNELVYQFAYNLQVPLVICMGGGYPKQISKGDVGSKSDGWEEIIDAHANVYVQAYQFLDERSAKIEK